MMSEAGIDSGIVPPGRFGPHILAPPGRPVLTGGRGNFTNKIAKKGQKYSQVPEQFAKKCGGKNTEFS
jgi:hypothetical protein